MVYKISLEFTLGTIYLHRPLERRDLLYDLRLIKKTARINSVLS